MNKSEKQTGSRIWVLSLNKFRKYGSSVHGIFQARMLDWVAIFYFTPWCFIRAGNWNPKGTWTRAPPNRATLSRPGSKAQTLALQLTPPHPAPPMTSFIHIKGRSGLPCWLRGRVCLPMQETWVPSLVWKDPTGCGAAKSMCHRYWACALEPLSCNY